MAFYEHTFIGKQDLSDKEVENLVTKYSKMIDKSGKDIRLEVDGGVNLNNIKDISEAGADTFVMGSAIFDSKDYEKTISSARKHIS